MYNLLISMAAAIACHLLLTFPAKQPLWVGAIAATLVFTICYILIMRFVMQKFTAIMETAQRDMQANRPDKAIQLMKSAYKYAPWQMFVKEQINAQVGMLLYLKRDFSGAFPYLEKAFVRHWVAMGMLAISYMKHNKPAKMDETFTKATSATKKEPLLWALHAYCLDKSGERNKAIAVLEKGCKRLPGEENLQENLSLLQENKKMKMKGFGDLWFQFHLEKPGAMIKKQTKAMTGRRKMVRR